MTEENEKTTSPRNLFNRQDRPVVPAEVMRPRVFLLLSALALMLIGLVMIYSASSVSALSDPDIADAAYYLKKQLLFIIAGAVLCLITAKIPYRTWMGVWGWVPWFLIIIVLVVTAAMGVVGLGAQRWITIPGIGTFQPSEFAKIAIILSEAALVQQYAEGIIDSRKFTWQTLVVIGVPCALIVAQPDLGTTIIAVVGALAVLWFGEIRLRPVLQAIAVVGVIGIVFILVSPYRRQRVETMFNPMADPLGDGYQILNSLYAFGSGGLVGVGLGNSAQKYDYLPEAHTDFIFSIIGEEMGLLGCLLVIGLFVVFVICGIKIAQNAPSYQGRAIAGAATLVIGLQAVLNMACTLGIFPVTGKPLPFVSSGGSSLWATMILVGLIVSVSIASGRDTAYERRMDFQVISGGAEERERRGQRDTAAAYKKAREDREKIRASVLGVFGRSVGEDSRSTARSRDAEARSDRSRNRSGAAGSSRGSSRSDSQAEEARRRSETSRHSSSNGTIQLADARDRRRSSSSRSGASSTRMKDSSSRSNRSGGSGKGRGSR